MQICGDILSKDRKPLQCISVATGMTGWGGNNIFISSDWTHLCSQHACKCRPGAGGHVQVYWDYPGNKTMYFMLFIWEHSCFLSWYFRGERERAHKGSKPLQVIWKLWAE